MPVLRLILAGELLNLLSPSAPVGATVGPETDGFIKERWNGTSVREKTMNLDVTAGYWKD